MMNFDFMFKMATPVRRWLVCVLPFFFLGISASAQDSSDYIPDGTQGERLEVLKTDTSKLKWRDKRWRLFNGRITTFKLGMGFLYEFAGFSQDNNSKIQMDSLGTPLESKFKVRDFRFFASGQFKTKRNFSWKLGLMYDATQEAWLVRESGFMIAVPEIKSSFFVGRTKEGFSLNKVMNGYAGWTFERQMALDVIPILADGIKWLGYLPEKRIFWNLGYYVDWLSEGQGFSTYSSQFAFRAGWLPIKNDKLSEVLHLGINYRYGNVYGKEIQLRSRPESNPAPFFLSTGKFETDHSTHIGYEAYYRKGRLMAGSEFYWHSFNSNVKGDPVFKGGDAVITYIFTGGIRPYNTGTSILGFVSSKKSVFKGGLGTIEGVLRFSTMDMNSGAIQGGRFWRLTPMVNWYMTSDIRLELGYGYGVLDRFGIKGATQFFQTRIQIAFL